MNRKLVWMFTLGVVGLGAGSLIPGCGKEPAKTSEVKAADNAAAQKAAADKAAADKAAADKAAAAKAAADKAAADKAAADKAAADKALADKAMAEKVAAAKAEGEKAAADKAAADKAAADKAAAQANAEAAALPPDLLEMKAEIARMKAQLDLTMVKLGALTSTTGDLEKPKEDALAAIGSLETESQGLKKRGEEMRDRGAAYFEEWEKQLAAMSTPAVAELAAKRKDELAAKYAEVLTAMQETGSASVAFWTDMQSIKRALQEDLTPEANQALAPTVQGATEKAATLKSRIDATFEKLGQVGLIYAKR